MTVIFLLGHFSRKLTRRNTRPRPSVRRCRRPSACASHAGNQRDRSPSHANWALSPLESSLINSFELREQLEEIQSLDRFIWRPILKCTLRQLSRVFGFHVSISSRRLARGNSFQSAKKLPQNSEREGGKGIRHTGRVAYLNENVRHEIYLPSLTKLASFGHWGI